MRATTSRSTVISSINKTCQVSIKLLRQHSHFKEFNHFPLDNTSRSLRPFGLMTPTDRHMTTPGMDAANPCKSALGGAVRQRLCASASEDRYLEAQSTGLVFSRLRSPLPSPSSTTYECQCENLQCVFLKCKLKKAFIKSR